MYAIINDKSKYLFEPPEYYPLNISTEGRQLKQLFGKDVLVRYGNVGDEWLWHLHMKVNDVCNAKCPFCIESENPIIKYDEDKYLKMAEKVLNEQYNAGILFSTSITGGEPLLFGKLDELLTITDKFNLFLTINTNGHYIKKNINVLNRHKIDFLNISMHSHIPSENNAVMGIKPLSIDELSWIKSNFNGLIRIQCVMMKGGVDTYDKMLEFMNYYKDIAYDFSFRNLIGVNESISESINKFTNEHRIDFRSILDEVYQNGELVVQEIQDYYIYETWNLNGFSTTFSYSNMDILLKSESIEDVHISREFILHPDSVYSSSWDKNNKLKIIYKQP